MKQALTRYEQVRPLCESFLRAMECQERAPPVTRESPALVSNYAISKATFEARQRQCEAA